MNRDECAFRRISASIGIARPSICLPRKSSGFFSTSSTMFRALLHRHPETTKATTKAIPNPASYIAVPLHSGPSLQNIVNASIRNANEGRSNFRAWWVGLDATAREHTPKLSAQRLEGSAEVHYLNFHMYRIRSWKTYPNACMMGSGVPLKLGLEEVRLAGLRSVNAPTALTARPWRPITAEGKLRVKEGISCKQMQIIFCSKLCSS